MTSLVRHRGPDDEGYLLVAEAGAAPVAYGGPDTPDAAYQAAVAFAPSRPFEPEAVPAARLAFGHRRLSILDLSTCGHQPLCTPDRRHWIIHNGEVYNYREIGAELAALGHRFQSQTDTEVILAAWAEWGPACLARFVGMWAFAIYDAHAGEIFLARDRFGIKPLYYWVAPDGTFCFASEIKQFTAFPGWRAAVNTPRAADFLATGLTDHTDETLFDRVYQVRPGQMMWVPLDGLRVSGDGRVAVESWYTLQASAFDGDPQAAADECRARLAESVRLMLRADVPIGSCLSGGIDSSAIVCLMHGLLRDEGAAGLQRTFSAVSDVQGFDERPWIEEVVRATRVDAHFVTPDLDDLLGSVDRLGWHQDEPYGSTSIFAQWSVFALAARHRVPVMLDGQGADEQFAGYHSFFPPYLAGLLTSGRVAACWREVQAIKRRHGYSARHQVRGLARHWLRPPPGQGIGTVQGLSRAQLTATNLQMLLRWEDRNSMAHSVESRVPFLDHRLVEFALGLPDAFKLGGGVTKRVLREAMSGILPDRVRDRIDKRAFETPEAHWMRQRPDAFRARLRDAVAAGHGLIDAGCESRFDEMLASTRSFGPEPWRAIALGAWMRAFDVSPA